MAKLDFEKNKHGLIVAKLDLRKIKQYYMVLRPMYGMVRRPMQGIVVMYCIVTLSNSQMVRETYASTSRACGTRHIRVIVNDYVLYGVPADVLPNGNIWQSAFGQCLV